MNKWIKCTDQLPEEGKYVLIWDGNLNLENIPFYEIAAYRTFRNGSFFVAGPYTLHNVKYWMELPVPPKDALDESANNP